MLPRKDKRVSIKSHPRHEGFGSIGNGLGLDRLHDLRGIAQSRASILQSRRQILHAIDEFNNFKSLNDVVLGLKTSSLVGNSSSISTPIICGGLTPTQPSNVTASLISAPLSCPSIINLSDSATIVGPSSGVLSLSSSPSISVAHDREILSTTKLSSPPTIDPRYPESQSESKRLSRDKVAQIPPEVLAAVPGDFFNEVTDKTQRSCANTILEILHLSRPKSTIWTQAINNLEIDQWKEIHEYFIALLRTTNDLIQFIRSTDNINIDSRICLAYLHTDALRLIMTTHLPFVLQLMVHGIPERFDDASRRRHFFTLYGIKLTDVLRLNKTKIESSSDIADRFWAFMCQCIQISINVMELCYHITFHIPNDFEPSRELSIWCERELKMSQVIRFILISIPSFSMERVISSPPPSTETGSLIWITNPTDMIRITGNSFTQTELESHKSIRRLIGVTLDCCYNLVHDNPAVVVKGLDMTLFYRLVCTPHVPFRIIRGVARILSAFGSVQPDGIDDIYFKTLTLDLPVDTSELKKYALDGICNAIEADHKAIVKRLSDHFESSDQIHPLWSFHAFFARRPTSHSMTVPHSMAVPSLSHATTTTPLAKPTTTTDAVTDERLPHDNTMLLERLQTIVHFTTYSYGVIGKDYGAIGKDTASVNGIRRTAIKILHLLASFRIHAVTISMLTCNILPHIGVSLAITDKITQPLCQPVTAILASEILSHYAKQKYCLLILRDVNSQIDNLRNLADKTSYQTSIELLLANLFQEHTVSINDERSTTTTCTIIGTLFGFVGNPHIHLSNQIRTKGGVREKGAHDTKEEEINRGIFDENHEGTNMQDYDHYIMMMFEKTEFELKIIVIELISKCILYILSRLSPISSLSPVHREQIQCISNLLHIHHKNVLHLCSNSLSTICNELSINRLKILARGILSDSSRSTLISHIKRYISMLNYIYILYQFLRITDKFCADLCRRIRLDLINSIEKIDIGKILNIHRVYLKDSFHLYDKLNGKSAPGAPKDSIPIVFKSGDANGSFLSSIMEKYESSTTSHILQWVEWWRESVEVTSVCLTTTPASVTTPTDISRLVSPIAIAARHR